MSSTSYNGCLTDGVFATTPTDRKAIPQAVLDIRQKTRSNPLKWKGQFSPQFVEAILKHYQSNTTRVLDPFAGSGTVLVEAARLGLPAIGLEVNPAAASLAKVYTLAMLNKVQREAVVARLLELTAAVTAVGPLFESETDGVDPADVLLSAWNASNNGSYPRGLPVALAALVTLADFYKRPLKRDKICAIRSRLVELIRTLPSAPQGGIEVRLADARNSGLAENSVDLVLTSPPYINVFNYHQKYRASAEAMGWRVLRAARSEIGSNRKHRQNRVLTVIQYCLDMSAVFVETRRVLSDQGTAVFVVGRESMVRKTPFYNSEIIAEVAAKVCGFKLGLKQERVFTNRFGQSIYEDILHFAPGDPALPPAERDAEVRRIAYRVLEETLGRCSDEVRNDIESARLAVPRVKPSQILNPDELMPSE